MTEKLLTGTLNLNTNKQKLVCEDFVFRLYCVYTMFPAVPAAPFARNVACRGVLVIHFSDF